MQGQHPIKSDEQLNQIIAKTRELVRFAAQILDQPPPDTFLGRKTREESPRQEHPSD